MRSTAASWTSVNGTASADAVSEFAWRLTPPAKSIASSGSMSVKLPTHADIMALQVVARWRKAPFS